MERDPKLASLDIEPIVNVSSVLEDLVAIDIIASDKTGTLTKNILRFRSLATSTIVYSHEVGVFPEFLRPLVLCH